MTVLTIYNTHYAALVRYAHGLCHDEHTAWDLVQQVFVKALEHQTTLEAYPNERVEGWLFMAVRNAFIDMLRKHRSHESLFKAPEQVYEEAFMAPFIIESLDKLPKPIGDCCRMRHFQGMNATEIGKVLNIPPATVRTRLRTASKLLKAEYEKEQI